MLDLMCVITINVKSYGEIVFSKNVLKQYRRIMSILSYNILVFFRAFSTISYSKL